MKNSELILRNKTKILPELIGWVESFNPENIIYNKNRIEEGEEENMFKCYEYLYVVVERLKSNQCSDEDFEAIIFQVNQINYNETKIEL
jgi:hypothetical protein